MHALLMIVMFCHLFKIMRLLFNNSVLDRRICALIRIKKKKLITNPEDVKMLWMLEHCFGIL